MIVIVILMFLGPILAGLMTLLLMWFGLPTELSMGFSIIFVLYIIFSVKENQKE